jgi:hypothetical protein
MSHEPLKWHDRNAKDNPAFLDALAKVRDMGVHEGWCYHHVKAILIAIGVRPVPEILAIAGRRFCILIA